jgi:dienelactone hydrolase
VSGEKQPGNDHFRDGVRSYLTGTSSNRYFVLDALRCVDYLATRSDVDMSNGVGMTGVSGGGITTMMATLLDDRITASGPACCAVSNIMHPVLDGYAPCPETLAANRFREYDDNDLLAAACPTPLLLMAGAQDEVFQGAWSDTIAADTRAMYEKAAKNDRFAYFSDPGGHAYTVAMAVEFTKWMDQWVALRARTIPALSEKDFVMDPPELLRCSPNTSVNMFTINRDLARKLREGYAPATPVAAIRDVLGISGTLSAPEYRANPDTLAWFHWMREMMLMPEPGIELPCTYLRPSRKDWKGAAVLWIDEQGRWTGLRQQGFLSTLTGFIDRETNGPALLTVDCRGWGDTAPAHIAYDMPGWAGRDRWMAYVSAALGDSVFAMRVRDGLAALAWLRAQPEIDPGRVSVGGRGMGAVVAAHVAAVAGDCARLAMLEPLAAFGLLAESEAYAWDHEAFAPGVLKRYDLPQLVNGLTAPVLIVNPLNAEKKAMNSKQLGAVSDAYGSKVTWVADVESGKAQAEIVAFLK